MSQRDTIFIRLGRRIRVLAMQRWVQFISIWRWWGQVFGRIFRRCWSFLTGMFLFFIGWKGELVKQKLQEIGKNSPKKLKNSVQEKKKKYKLYVYRFLSDGSVCNAKPCAECSRWMYVASMMGIHYEIYHTDDDKTLKLFDYNCTHYIPKTTYFCWKFKDFYLFIFE